MGNDKPYNGWPEARPRRVGPVKRGQNGRPSSQFCFLDAKSCYARGSERAACTIADPFYQSIMH